MARITSEEAGNRAWDVLATHPGGLTRRRLAELAGLSAHQLTRGVEYLRDLFGEGKAIVVLWEGRENIYRIAVNDQDVRGHAMRWMKGRITSARREFTWWHDQAAAFSTRENRWQEEQARHRLASLNFAYEQLREELGEAA